MRGTIDPSGSLRRSWASRRRWSSSLYPGSVHEGTIEGEGEGEGGEGGRGRGEGEEEGGGIARRKLWAIVRLRRSWELEANMRGDRMAGG